MVLVSKQGKLYIILMCRTLPALNCLGNMLWNLFSNDYLIFSCFVFGDRVADDGDVSVVNCEDCMSNYMCLLQNKVRLFPLGWAREKEIKWEKRIQSFFSSFPEAHVLFYSFCLACQPCYCLLIFGSLNSRHLKGKTLERKAVTWRIAKWLWPWQCVDVSETLTLEAKAKPWSFLHPSFEVRPVTGVTCALHLWRNF